MASTPSSRPTLRIVTASRVGPMVGAVSNLLSGVLTNDISLTNEAVSVRAQDVIDAQVSSAHVGKSTEYVIVQSDSLTVDDAAYQTYVKQLQTALAAKTDLLAARPTTYYDALSASPDAAAGLVSKDKHYTLIPVASSKDDTATFPGLPSTL